MRGAGDAPRALPAGFRRMTKEEFVSRMLRDAEARALSEITDRAGGRGEDDPYGEEIPAEILRVAGGSGVKGEEDG